jgi:hypothetical protein
MCLYRSDDGGVMQERRVDGHDWGYVACSSHFISPGFCGIGISD